MDFPELNFTSEEGWFGFLLPGAKRAILPVQRPEGVLAFLVDFQSAKGRAVTPPLLKGTALSPDRRFFAATSLDGGVSAYPLEEGSPRVLAGVGPDDKVVGWTNRGLLVIPDGRLGQGYVLPVRIFRVNPETGTRELFLTLTAGDGPGANVVLALAVTPDERTVAYSYYTRAATLYLYEFGSDAQERRER